MSDDRSINTANMGVPPPAYRYLSAAQPNAEVPDLPTYAQDAVTPAAVAPAVGGAQPQPDKSPIRKLLSNFFTQLGTGMGMPNLTKQLELGQMAAQTEHLNAQTEMVKRQTQMMGTMVTLPNGMQVPASHPLAKVMLQEQGKNLRSQANISSKEKIAGINDALKAAGLGVQIGEDENGNPKLTNLEMGQMAPMTQANIRAKGMNNFGLIARAQGGDAEAQRILDADQQRKIAVTTAGAAARGQAFGYYRPQMYYDPEMGQSVPYFAGDAMRAIQGGKALIPSSTMPANVLLGFQRLNSEAKPAIEGVGQNLGAFDNPSDRAVFARVMKENPMSEGADPHTWMGNMLDQALKGGLSPQGQQLVVKLNRLNETLNLLRTTIGAPTTNAAMSIAMRLVPGASTPNSGFAKQQLDELNQIVEQANVQMVGGPHGQPSGAPAQGGGVMEQYSKSRNQYRYSTDGGKTWQMGRAPKQ